jgi:hypothetical protein
MSKKSDKTEEPLYKLMHEEKQKELKLKIPKYNLILEFINKITELENKSLKDFKKFNLNNIKEEYFEEILAEYRYKLEGELEIDIDNINIDIVKILSDCLGSIDYSIIKQKTKDNNNKENLLLTIIDESKEEILNKIKEKKRYQ